MKCLPLSYGSVPLTSVQPPESFEHGPPYCVAECVNLSRQASGNFRHSCWRGQRKRMLQTLVDVGFNWQRVYRFSHCGDQAFVIRSREDPDHIRIAGSSCRDRWCLPCAKDRSRTIAANLTDLTTGKRLRLMTLTLAHRPVHLRAEVDRLQASFSSLRRLSEWKDRIEGGVAILEVARGSKNESWHPHLHVIYEGKYFPQPKLKELWYRVTGDSYIVDIRNVESESMLVNYVTKYVSKPWTGDVERDPLLMAEIVCALDKRRMCTTFGTWRGVSLTVSPLSDAWENLGSLEHFLRLARDGDTEAQRLLASFDRSLVAECLGLVPSPRQAPRSPPGQLYLWSGPTYNRAGTNPG